jgi:drug/metabolite transporter (DMT)-like permease
MSEGKKPCITVNTFWGGAMLIMGVAATILAKLQVSTKATGTEKCYFDNDTKVENYGSDDTLSGSMRLTGFEQTTQFTKNHKKAFEKVVMEWKTDGLSLGVGSPYAVTVFQVYKADKNVINVNYEMRSTLGTASPQITKAARNKLDDIQAHPGKFKNLTNIEILKHSGNTITVVAIETGATVWNKFCTFSKPWFICLEMKFAMACCLIWHFATMKKKKNEDDIEKDISKDALLSGEEEEEPDIDPRCYWYLAGPAFLDMTQTVMGNVGLVLVSPSIYQMLKGSVIVFSALFMVKFLGAKLFRHHYASMGIIVVAIGMVGVAGLFEDSDSSSTASEKMLGIVSILLAQIIMAAQIVSEEYLMTKMHCSPVLVVGMEGLWGLLYFAMIGPILTHTPESDSRFALVTHEDFGDSFSKIGASHPLLVITIIETFIIGAYNLTANYVTKRLNAVVRSILEACRTLGVWVLDLAFYYVFVWRGNTSPAEEWSKYSVLEFFGFCLLVYGTFAYKELVPIPGIPRSNTEA